MAEYAQILEKFDLSPTASKVYIALLELGKASADTIAKRINSYKANVYSALDKLEEYGLSTYIYEGKKKQYIPTSPKKLPNIIENLQKKQNQHYDDLKKDLSQIMPELQAKFASVKQKELFEVYKGKRAYKAVIQEILKEQPKVWKGFGNFQIQAAFPLEFQRWFKTVPFRLFSTKSKEVEERKKEASKTCDVQVTWLPQEVFMPIVWVVFGENVLIIIYEPDLIMMRIKSEQVVKTFSNQFDYLWKKYNATLQHKQEQ